MESSILSDLAFEQSFLNGLSAGQMEKVIAMARVVPFAPDQIIFREREPPDQVYLILSGSVALEICTPVHILRVQTLEEGDELGWPFSEREPRPFQARSLEAVGALKFERRPLTRACKEDPELEHALEHRLLQLVSSRLQAALFQLLDVYGSGESGQRSVLVKIAS